MALPKISKTVAAWAAFVALLVMGMTISSTGRAASDSQDEKHMIRIGLETAPVTLNLSNKDPDLVGLGGYLVNVVADCNGCHSDPTTTYTATGNPYFLVPPNGPY